MRRIAGTAGILLGGLLAGAAARADEPPLIEHQPSPCTVPGQAYRLCAKVSDDLGVGKVRVYFRRASERYYAFTDMTFDGLKYCATLPAPHEGRTHVVEYYVQALDSTYQAQRTSTFQLQVKPETECEFAPVEPDPQRRARIIVYATHAKQGKKLSDSFLDGGVMFVPATR